MSTSLDYELYDIDSSIMDKTSLAEVANVERYNCYYLDKKIN